MEKEYFKDFPDVVTVDDVQTMLHIGKNSVYKLLHDGKIKSYQNGKNFIIPKISVINFINSITM